MRVAVAGFGDLGQRLAHSLVAKGDALLGLRRSPVRAGPGIETRACDVAALAPQSLSDWGAEALVIALTPDSRSPEGYRRAYLDPLPTLAAAFGPSLQRTLLVSSTAVYGEAAEEWVDECTPPAPPRWNGELLWQAEARAAECLPGLVVARASGLYGPGREQLLRRALEGEPGDGRWTNRIHVDDAAAALGHLLALPAPERCYILVDDCPAPEHVVLDGLRALHGRPVTALPAPPARGRRLSNARLRKSGWRPRYPTWREGYAALLAR